MLVDIEGASYNSGNLVTHENNSRYETYLKGLARWGEGKDALYCYYDTSLSYDASAKNGFINDGLRFGGKDNYVFSSSRWRTISKIETDEGITLYALYYRYKYYAELAILGCLKNGSFVKYIDINVDFSKKYFGNNFGEVNYGPEDWNKSGDISTYIRCQGDTIIVPYFVVGYNPHRTVETGEFRFKWDDAAQWFGVEKIVY